MSLLSNIGTFFASDLGQSLAGQAVKTATSLIQGSGSNTSTNPAMPLVGSGSINVGGTTVGVGNTQTPVWLWPVVGGVGFLVLIFAFMSNRK